MSLDLFEQGGERPHERRSSPLADRMRPGTLDEVAGQDHLLAKERPFRRAVDAGLVSSMVLWGPPGSGKTTLARLIAAATSLPFQSYSAVMSGVREIRQVVERARQERKASGRATLLFVDEIHRFNKAQQDAFLPHVESGLVILVGATTENPSFEVNSALLSRLQVFILEPLSFEVMVGIVERALADEERGLGERRLDLEPAAIEAIARFSGGDARVALGVLEAVARSAPRGQPIDPAFVEAVAGRPIVRHDRAGDEHYAIISALIKSVRGSDADAAVYWLARLIEGGEDPLFIARRLVILASEDIGNADPQALPLATAAFQATHSIGMPEAQLILSQATIYLALAPKSNAATVAIGRARADAQRTGTTPVPLHLRPAPTRLMSDLGFGQDYKYSHTEEDALQEYLPEELRGRRYVEPTDSGYESDQRRRIEERRRARAAAKAPDGRQGD